MMKHELPVFIRQLATLLAILVTLFVTPSRAQQAAISPTPTINVLDGKTFTGEIVPIGNSSGRAEDFVFADGKFHSKVCLDWGFKPGPYWVRLENGRLHFLAKLISPENGVMTFQGTIAGPKIDATVAWIKPRWYWTMERQFRFRGNDNKSIANGGS